MFVVLVHAPISKMEGVVNIAITKRAYKCQELNGSPH